MTIIDKISSNIADFIRNHNENAASKEVLTFSIGIFLNTLLVTLIILLVAAITGRFLNAVILLVSYVALRYVSGGMHLPSSTICNIFSVTVFVILIHLPVTTTAALILNGLALLLVLIYAPTKDILELSWLGPKYKVHLKIASIAIVVANFFIQSPILALAFFVQALTLMPISYKFASLFERG